MSSVLKLAFVLLSALPLMGQGKRLWVLRPSGEMVEYDAATFAVKRTVKVPPEASKSPQNLVVNHLGQMLFAPTASLPLSESDAQISHKVWFWNGQSAITFDQGVTRETAQRGSNLAITESAPQPYLSVDGNHIFWFDNRARRLQREEMDLSTTNTWEAWRTDLSGSSRADLASSMLPACRCPTASCEETCPYGEVWVPQNGVEKFFLLTHFVAGQSQPAYKASFVYKEEAGAWKATSLASPLQRILDAASGGDVIVEAIPDTGCCGWSNQSNDQTLLLDHGKTVTIFDEQAAFSNSDYDVTFYTASAWLSPELESVAMTIVATAEPNQPVQLAEEGQASPEELQHIRKALAELPAVEVKSLGDSPHRLAFLPHATAVGWISGKEILIIENHLLVAYNAAAGTRRRSSIHVEDVAHVFLR
jgi:hypothetical protein